MKLILKESRIGIGFKNLSFGLISLPWLHMFGQPKYTASFWEWFFYISEIRHDYFNFKQFISIRLMWFAVEVGRL